MSEQIVSAVKTELEQRQMSLVGPCGAAAIVVRVGWRLRADGWGYMRTTPPHNGCEVPNAGYIRTDTLMTKAGWWCDILVSAGGEEYQAPDPRAGQPIPGTGNYPSWQFHDGSDGQGLANPADWVAPIGVDLGDEPDVPDPPHPPTGEVPAYAAVLKRHLDELQLAQDGLTTRVDAIETALEGEPLGSQIIAGQLRVELLALQASLELVVVRIAAVLQVA